MGWNDLTGGEVEMMTHEEWPSGSKERKSKGTGWWCGHGGGGGGGLCCGTVKHCDGGCQPERVDVGGWVRQASSGVLRRWGG